MPLRPQISETQLLPFDVQCVVSGEELVIFYGSTLWFEDHASGASGGAVHSPDHRNMDDPAVFLSSLQL